MRISSRVFALAVILAAAASAQPAPASIGKVVDQEFTMIEREFVPLAEAMPADKFHFVPKDGEFAGVRTFAQQVTHTAAIIYLVGASLLGEKNPTDLGEQENGPASLKTKEEIINYLKEAFAYGHKAIRAQTSDASWTEQVQSPFGKFKTPRLGMGTTLTWHSFDHYGQMVVYARMNGVVPPASRR